MLMGKFLHIRYLDGEVEHLNVEYGNVIVEDGVLKYREKNNYREIPKTKRGFPLVNIRTYWFSDWEDR